VALHALTNRPVDAETSVVLRKLGPRVLAGTCGLLAVVLAAAVVVTVRERRDAELGRDLATARGLAFASGAVLDSSPESALLLALEACRRACDRPPEETYEVRHSLLTAIQQAALLDDVLALRGVPQAVAVSPDGRRVAVTTFTAADERGSLVVFDLLRRRSWSTSLKAAFELVFTPNGRRIVTEGWGVVRVYDAERLTPAAPPLEVTATGTLEGRRFSDDVGSAELSSDGRLAAVWGTHGVFNVWDVAHRRPLRNFPQSRFDGGLLAPGGRTLVASGSGGGRVTMWDLERGRAIGTIPFASSSVRFSADGRTAAFATALGIRLWDVAHHASRGAPLRGPRAVDSIVFDPTGERLAAAADGAVWVWNLHRPASEGRRAAAGRPIAFGPTGRTLLVSSKSRLRLLDVARREPLAIPPPLLGAETITVFTPDETRLVSASRDGTVRLWNLAPGNPLVLTTARHDGEPYRVIARAWTPDGRMLISGGFDGSVAVIPLAKRSPTQLPPAENPIVSVQVSADGKTLATLAATHDVALWDGRTAKSKGTIPLPYESAVAFAEGGQTVAVLAAGNVRFWNLERSRFERRHYRLFSRADKLAIAPDGATIAASDDDGNVYLWPVRDGRLGERTLLHRRVTRGGYVPTVNSLGFSADGSVLLSSADDDQVRLFDVRRALPLGDPLPVDGAAAISPRDSTLASAVGRGVIAIWDEILLSLDSSLWERRICAMTHRGLTRSEWRRFLPGEPYHPVCSAQRK
jgi:WD40 repeat protein